MRDQKVIASGELAWMNSCMLFAVGMLLFLSTDAELFYSRTSFSIQEDHGNLFIFN